MLASLVRLKLNAYAVISAGFDGGLVGKITVIVMIMLAISMADDAMIKLISCLVFIIFSLVYEFFETSISLFHLRVLKRFRSFITRLIFIGRIAKSFPPLTVAFLYIARHNISE